MAARSDLKVKEFIVETDPTKLADKWAEWIDNLEYNFKYFTIEDAETKKAAMMVYGEESLRKIHNNLPDRSSDDVFVNAKTKLIKYFSSKKNIDYLIYQFREILKGDNESFLTFVDRLREVAKHCEFPDKDKKMKRQIIQKTSNRKVRQKALEKRLTSDEILNIGLTDETAKRQARDMKKATGNDMNSVNKISNRKFDRKRTVTGKNDNFNCQRCGKRYGPKECPAWQKTCSSCGKMSHSQLMCKSKKRADGKFTPKPKPAENRRDHRKKVDESHQSSSDHE